MSAADVPKAELHVHLEGAFAPATARRLAARNGIDLDAGVFDGDDGYKWDGFLNFLEVFDVVSAAAVRTEEDYRDITYDYLSQCAAEGVVYAELICSPSHGEISGLPYDAMLRGLVAGVEDATAHGIEGYLLMSCVRHFGVEAAMKTVGTVAAQPHERVVGWHMGGDELALSFADFAPVYAVARDAGLHCAVHAGEFGGPQAVRDALDTLPVQRLGHGVQAAADPELVAELAARGITLECCPTSNIATGVFPDYATHPWPALRDAGCKVTLNSDDPPYFHTTVGREYEVAADHFGVDDEGLRDVTRTALGAGFAPPAVREEILRNAGLGLA